jgi:catechol 2,3-dioxygenase-like lactoylglutathione lyase family enzyme
MSRSRVNGVLAQFARDVGGPGCVLAGALLDISAKPPLSHEKPTPCRLSERSDAVGGREPASHDGSSSAPRPEAVMGDLKAVEIKAFVPARDFALSKQFYEDLGFTIAWSDSDLAYLRCGDCSFLLQNFYQPEHAGNFMMHLLVEDVETWWRHVEKAQLASAYGARAEPPADRPWGMRDFTIADPTGVHWRIAQNIR